MAVSREDWLEWKEHPVTQALWAMLEEHHRELELRHLEDFRQRVDLSDDAHERQVKIALRTGAWEVCDAIINMDETELSNE